MDQKHRTVALLAIVLVSLGLPGLVASSEAESAQSSTGPAATGGSVHATAAESGGVLDQQSERTELRATAEIEGNASIEPGGTATIVYTVTNVGENPFSNGIDLYFPEEIPYRLEIIQTESEYGDWSPPNTGVMGQQPAGWQIRGGPGTYPDNELEPGDSITFSITLAASESANGEYVVETKFQYGYQMGNDFDPEFEDIWGNRILRPTIHVMGEDPENGIDPRVVTVGLVVSALLGAVVTGYAVTARGS